MKKTNFIVLNKPANFNEKPPEQTGKLRYLPSEDELTDKEAAELKKLLQSDDDPEQIIENR